jgi:general L-amino acid transport system permease protein
MKADWAATLSALPTLRWLRRNLFSSLTNAITTLIIGYLIWKLVPGFFGWTFVHAIWFAPDGALCREAAGTGACWAFVTDKHRFILFGTYPFEEQWRPALTLGILFGLYGASTLRALRWLLLTMMWLAGVAAISALMLGGVFGLPYVGTDRWGGLVLTLLLSTFGIAFAFPLALLLALGRRSGMPVIRWLSVIYIEIIRGVPLISVLFMASVMVPLFLPAEVTIDKLLRAQVAMSLFAAAYLAEVVRAGLQALPRGQDEAARALGLTYWQRHRYVILPQALRIAIPSMVNTFIGFFKDTSLVLIIGLFDLLTAIKVSLNEPAWSGFGVEAYLFAALVYFLFCFPISRYSRRLERRLSRRSAPFAFTGQYGE